MTAGGLGVEGWGGGEKEVEMGVGGGWAWKGGECSTRSGRGGFFFFESGRGDSTGDLAC